MPPSAVKIAVTAYFTGVVGDVEKTSSVDALIGSGSRSLPWEKIMASLINQAIGGLEEFPFPMELMSERQIESYRAKMDKDE